MRWSPLISLSLFTVLAITSIFESVFAAPLDVEITARSLKNSKSSATYRKPTLRDIHRTTRISGKIPKKIADFIRPKVQVHRPALSGNTAHASGHVKDYMKQTATASKDTAKKHGVSGVSVQKEHQGALKNMGLKRELSLEELD